MNQFVLDCSVTMSWFFSDETNENSLIVMNNLLSGRAFVPAIWPLEVVNTLLVSEKRKRLTKSESLWILEKLDQMSISVDNTKVNKRELLALAKENKLSSYDATYLELSIRLNLPLATNDSVLQTVAKSKGIDLVLSN